MFKNLFKKEKHAIKEMEKEVKEANKSEKLRDDFFSLFFMVSYSKGKKRKDLIKKAKKIADKTPEYKGWPKDANKFWNVEAFGWDARIPEKIRKFIKKELRKRTKGKTIELGSGSCPYVSKSVLIDFSEEMLNNAPKAYKKIHSDLNKELPFKNSCFDSASAVFVVDYLDNLNKTLKEIKRILKKNGKLIIIQSKKPISDYYHKHENKFWKASELNRLLKSNNFKTKIDEFKIENNELVLIEAKRL